jgi:hypothetical protein
MLSRFRAHSRYARQPLAVFRALSAGSALAPVPNAMEHAVARYYFHMQTDTRGTDTDGIEFANKLDARKQAIVTCGQMMQDDPDIFWGSRPWSVTVTDNAGLIIWEISMDGVSSPAGSAL